MTSEDGKAWTIRASAADNKWSSVAYGSGLWVAVAASGSNSGCGQTGFIQQLKNQLSDTVSKLLFQP